MHHSDESRKVIESITNTVNDHLSEVTEEANNDLNTLRTFNYFYLKN